MKLVQKGATYAQVITVDGFCSTTKFTFHYLFTFTESIDKQHPLFQLITINYYMCVGGQGYCELLINFADFLIIVHAILLFQVSP